MKTPHSFHNRIAEARASLKIQQCKLAEKTGIKRRRLTRIEAGQARPSATEVEALACALQLSPEEMLQGSDWQKGSVRDGWLRSTAKALASIGKGPPVALQPDAKPFGDKLDGARRLYPTLVRHLEARISMRPDARSIWFALHQVWVDSCLEVLLWLHLAVEGFPVLTSPMELDFRVHQVLDWDYKLQVGDVSRIALWHPNIGIAIPQVCMLNPRCRVDCLLALGRGRFVVIEIDGDGHDGARDEFRDRDTKVPVLRFGSLAVQERNFLDRLKERLASTAFL